MIEHFNYKKETYDYKIDLLNEHYVCNGEAFITDKIDSKQKDFIINHYKFVKETSKNYLKFLRGHSNLPDILCIISLILAGTSVFWVPMLKIVPIYIISIVCFFISNFIILLIALNIYQKTKYNKFKNSEEYKIIDKNNRAINDNAKKVFKIPQSALKIDIIYERNTVIKSKLKYINSEVYAFIRESSLCLASISNIMTIPLKSITSLKKEFKKRVHLLEWNKDEAKDSKQYRQYRISGEDLRLYTKWYSLNIDDSRGSFIIMIPNYDAKALADLIDIEL